MKRKILTSILILLLLSPQAVCVENNINDNENKIFKVETIENFTNPSVEHMKLETIDKKINEQKEIQESAHLLAEQARDLDWPEECLTIENAKTEWSNAQEKILFYQEEYDKKYEQLEIEKWRSKFLEYPVATKIWLSLKNEGWNDFVCAGILGNMMVESGNQSLNISPSAKNGNSYYGICQWGHHYNTVWYTDLESQLLFLKETIKKEIDSFGSLYYNGFNYNDFLSLDNSQEVALVFAKCYERCSSVSYYLRQNCADEAYNYFS